MFRNHLKTAINVLIKNKFFSLINILGLALGITACLLILMYVVNELSYEGFQKNKKNIYRVALEWGTEENIMKFAGAMPALAPAIEEQIPEVEEAVRIRKDYDAAIKDRDNQETEEKNLFFADPGVFSIFSFYLDEGDPDHALDEPFCAVISKKISGKYFGKADPLGQQLFYHDTPLKITGVMKDVPENTHLQCEILVSYATLKALGQTADQPWNQWGDDLTYVLLKNRVSAFSVLPKLDTLLVRNSGQWLASRMKFDLQPLTSIHWDTDTRGDIGKKGNKTYILIFLSAAIFVLIIACFNFLNLSISQYLARMKEVAIRKTSGAGRRHLVFQLLTETMIIILISCLVAVLLFEQLYPALYSYLGTTYVLKNHHFLVLTLLVLAIIIIVGIASGSYPALYISRFRPIEILRKNTFGFKSRLTLRKLLMMFQFSISIILLVGTMIIFRQINYMKNSDLGFNKDDVILLNFQGLLPAVNEKYDVLKGELMKNPDIISMSGAYTIPGINSRMNISLRREDEPAENSVNIQALPADFGFVRAMGLEIVRGRDFSLEFPTDSDESILLNQSAVTSLGLKDPVGTMLMIPRDKSEKRVKVIGVVRDFHIQSFHEKINPMLIYINPRMYITIALRINPLNKQGAIDYMKKTWNSVLPGVSLNYRYLQDAYYSLYNTEEKSGQLLVVFTFLALFISCLGLFGFATFIVARRIKEVGIRKVMGARIAGISVLLSKQFLIWIFISSIIAIPVAYIIATEWLGNFAFHIKAHWWIFALSVCLELLIALFTVIWQSWRAAAKNPVEALRYE